MMPLIHLTGTPFEQGVQHGQQLREGIAQNLEVYMKRFKEEVKLSRDEVLRRATAYAEAIQAQNADYYETMQGVAQGSGFGLAEIAALNVRYEILYYEFGVGGAANLPDGCTAFALAPSATATKHLLMGQNWDWIPQVAGAVLRTDHSNGPATLAFTEAGIVGGKIGLNSAGLGLAINGMTTLDDDWETLRKPFHVRCYEILRQENFEATKGVVTEEARACTANFILAGTPDQIVDLEAAPERVNALSATQGLLVHANHFADPERMREAPSERREYSCHREARLHALLSPGQALSIPQIKEALRDHDGHPNSVCRHEDPDYGPEEHYITVTSVLMDLDTKTMWLSDGPPCENAYEEVSL